MYRNFRSPNIFCDNLCKGLCARCVCGQSAAAVVPDSAPAVHVAAVILRSMREVFPARSGTADVRLALPE
jgi:hypothetical protein